MIEDLWYKNAVIYTVNVETFMDANGDGVGDLEGLRRRLDYLAGLGVTCLWLLPFQPSPRRDNGYDVADYYGVDPRFGDVGDFVALAHQARLHGMRLIMDLVVNHTSDEHPWFRAARADRRSRYRDYYLWSESRPERPHEGVVFPGPQRAIWTWDDGADAWYYHRFFSFQPDLNVANPAVRAEILKIMGYWLELGVSGFRLDAVPFLIELPGERREKGHAFELLRDMREFLSWRRGDAILLAEANVLPDEAEPLFGEGNRLQMVFDFPVNQALFLSVVREDARPLAAALGRTPRLREVSQWAHFLRNHDELDLGRLTEEERQEVFRALGPDPQMQIFGRGLRRRLAPMLDGDRRRIELLFSLLLSLPGTPVLWYGDEIGMGEDLSLEGRTSVRTPMQWSSDPHGGFTHADAPFRSAVAEGAFAYPLVNVAAQRREPGSLLNATERLIRLRKECHEVGWGACTVIDVGEPAVLALRFDRGGERVVTLHNLAASSRQAVLRREDAPDALVSLLSKDHSPPGRDGSHRVELEGYAYRWFRVGTHDGAARVTIP